MNEIPTYLIYSLIYVFIVFFLGTLYYKFGPRYKQYELVLNIIDGHLKQIS